MKYKKLAENEYSVTIENTHLDVCRFIDWFTETRAYRLIINGDEFRFSSGDQRSNWLLGFMYAVRILQERFDNVVANMRSNWRGTEAENETTEKDSEEAVLADPQGVVSISVG